MLNLYINPQANTISQFILLDEKGIVIENESHLFKKAIGKPITALHPFFESVDFLSKNKNQEFNFKCINTALKGKTYIIDITIKTFEKDTNSLIIIDDLTRHYSNLQKVTQIRNEAIINAEVLKYKNRILEEKERFKNRFIRSFSHEIRIPINSINRMCLLLRDTNLSQTQRYNLNVVSNINDQLKHIISDILDISKIETGYFEVQTRAFNIYDMLDHINAITEQKCREKGLEFIYKIDASCPVFLEGDQYRLTQILTNLIENAIKFTTTGTIELEVITKSKTRNNIQLDFKISDTGMGIAHKDLKAIFNGFYQVNNNRIKDKGIGLGLSIVKHLVNVLEGTITVNSELKKGTTFTVNLPYLIAKSQIQNKKALQQKKQLKNALKVLVADPFSKAEKELESIFNQKKYILNFVESGDAVIESLNRTKYDVLIMNLKLPKMDGIDTIRYIRLSEDATFKNIPVVMVSTNKNEEEEKKCLKNKANAYISKPYEKNALAEKINALIKEKVDDFNLI